MKIYIKSLNKTYEFTINENHTIANFKQKIYKELKIHPYQQRFIFKGSPMMDEKTFKDLHVEENAILHLLFNII